MPAVCFYTRLRSRLCLSMSRPTLLLHRMSSPRRNWKNTNPSLIHRVSHTNQCFDHNPHPHHRNHKNIPPNNYFHPNPPHNLPSHLHPESNNHADPNHNINSSNDINPHANRLRNINLHINPPRLRNRYLNNHPHANRYPNTHALMFLLPPQLLRYRNRSLRLLQRTL
jgi:hypothetical protein